MTTTTGRYDDGVGPDMIAVSDSVKADGARSRIAWSAIFAGVVLVFAIELLLNTLGAGVGFGLVQTQAGATPSASSFSTSAGIWLLISTIVAFLASGYIASRLAGAPSHFDGLLHGVVVWGLTLLLALYMLGSAAGGLIGGAFHLAGGAASLVGQGASAAAPTVAQAAGVSSGDIQSRLQVYLAPTIADPSAMNAEQAQKAIAVEMPKLAQGGVTAAAARERIISIMAVQQNISHDEAARRFDNAQAQLEKDQQQAMQVAQASAADASKASYVTFGALLLGAIAAAVGGLLASPRRPTTVARRVA